jgi:hypothetical protein
MASNTDAGGISSSISPALLYRELDEISRARARFFRISAEGLRIPLSI